MPGSVPDPLFDDLARGAGGRAAAAHLCSAQYGKHLLLLRRVVDVAHETGHPGADRARDAYELLARAQQHAPDRGSAGVARPHRRGVGTPYRPGPGRSPHRTRPGRGAVRARRGRGPARRS